jgi:hypothetical protein
VGYRIFMTVLAAIGLMMASLGAQAQVILPDGKYESTDAYLAGSWKWEKPEPRATMRMRFGPGSTFFYENATTGLQHHGQYAMLPDGNVRVTIGRSCNNFGADCQNRSEPLVVVDPISPVSANVFMSNSEQWERQ